MADRTCGDTRTVRRVGLICADATARLPRLRNSPRRYPALVSIATLGVLALADGPVFGWAGRVGKIPLLMAGLVILLDLVGPERLTRWADSAAERREASVLRLQRARLARLAVTE